MRLEIGRRFRITHFGRTAQCFCQSFGVKCIGFVFQKKASKACYYIRSLEHAHQKNRSNPGRLWFSIYWWPSPSGHRHAGNTTPFPYRPAFFMLPRLGQDVNRFPYLTPEKRLKFFTSRLPGGVPVQVRDKLKKGRAGSCFFKNTYGILPLGFKTCVLLHLGISI